MTPSPHQLRVLVALWHLEQTYQWPWWSREAIGYVVAAGGGHETIQLATIRALKRGGLVHTQQSTWSAARRRAVRCACAACHWGLTGAGRDLAASKRVFADAAFWGRVDVVAYEARPAAHDEDEWAAAGCNSHAAADDDVDTDLYDEADDQLDRWWEG